MNMLHENQIISSKCFVLILFKYSISYGIRFLLTWFNFKCTYLLFRINNDLLLWEPTAPSPVETVESMPYGVGLSVASQLINTYSKDSFSQFRSTCPEGEAKKKEIRLSNSSGWLWFSLLAVVCKATQSPINLHTLNPQTFFYSHPLYFASRWDQWLRRREHALLLSCLWPRPPITQEEKDQNTKQNFPEFVLGHPQCQSWSGSSSN